MKNSKTVRTRIAVVALLLAAIGSGIATAAQEPPSQLPYNGILERDGKLVDGPVDLRFSLHATNAGNAAVAWKQEFTGVKVRKGRFSTLLGSAKAGLPKRLKDGYPMYLRISVKQGGGWVALGGAQLISPWSATAAPPPPPPPPVAPTIKLKVEDEQSVTLEDSGGEKEHDTLGDVDKRFCYLTGVSMTGFDADDEQLACRIIKEDGKWKLEAEVQHDHDNRVKCKARCLSW